MANGEDLKVYPPGQISLGSGKLVQSTIARVDYSNGAKLQHTMRFSPSGVVIGNKEVGGAIDTVVDEAGPERDYFEFVKAGTVKQFRYEIPGSDFSLVGVFTRIELELRTGDAVTLRASFIGKIES